MKSIKLYRVLSKHAGVINALAMAVYNEAKETEAALAEAKAEINRIAAELTNDKTEGA